MSAGQAVGGVIGAVAGFIIGGPGGGLKGAMYGAQIGMTVGGLIDPPKGPTIEGPRLDDLTVQTSTYGGVIPRVYGTIALTGNVFWLENNKLKEVVTETRSRSGGKGGGSKTTTRSYSYYATFAVGLCDCPAAPIVGVKRIWIAGRLWYDAGSSDMDAIFASNSASELFTLHNGDEDQLPDERMQATLGVANTPAYRGLAYIVFKDLPLAEYSNSLMGAQIKVEVVSYGVVSSQERDGITPIFGSQYQLSPAFADFGGVAISQWPYPTDSYLFTTDAVNWSVRKFPEAQWWVAIGAKSDQIVAIFNYAGVCSTRNGLTWRLGVIPYAGWSVVAWNGAVWCAAAQGVIATSDDGEDWNSLSGSIFAWQPTCIITHGRRIILSNEGRENYVVSDDDGSSWSTKTFPWGAGLGLRSGASDGSIIVGILGDETFYSISSDGGDTWVPATSILDGHTFSALSIRYGLGWFGIQGYGIAGNGIVFSQTGSGWEFFHVDAMSGATFYSDRTFDFTGYGFAAVATNGGRACYCVTPGRVSSTDPTLASIISAEVAQSNLLAPSDIDVTGLTQPVRGYRIAAVAALRSGIEPLQGVWPFDVIQSGYTIKFKPRGSVSVVTVPAGDLDARAAGQGPGVSITNVREMDSQLPRKVRVSFLDYDREYDTNEQSDERQATDAVNITSIDLAVVLTAGEAAGIAQVLLYLYWLERYDVTYSLPASYNALEPGDTITVQATEATYSLRLTAITYTSDGRLECTAKYDSAAVYTPTAIGVAPVTVPQTLTRTGDSLLVLLDIPTLIDSSDRPGYVAAIAGILAGWQGGVIYRSDDSGQTWTTLQAFAAPGSSIGYAINAIAAGRTDLFDTASALTIYMAQGALASVSEAAVLNGTNYFAYGAPGRWEIIGVKNCTLQSDGGYVLTDLLRGRKGSEWACGLHAAGDTLVALDAATVDFISSSVDAIGSARTYRGVTVGQDLAAARDLGFTYSGVNFECLAPCYAAGSRTATGDWTISWIRRTRVGGEWRDYVDASLGESSESYVIEIYASSAFLTIKRTLTASTSSVSYPITQQITDFGVAQSAIYAKVYQVSASVGMGYPLQATFVQGISSVLLMHMDDAGLTDAYGNAVTLYGGATRSATQSKFGGYSGYFNGTSYATIPASTDFDFGSGPFTIEFWLYRIAPETCRVLMFGTNDSALGLQIYIASDGSGWFGEPTANSPISGLTITAATFATGSWQHIAMVWESTTTYAVYVDGVQKIRTTSGKAWGTGSRSLSIGVDPSYTPAGYLNGYIDELRITKGIARYTADFSANLQTSPFID